MNKQFIRQMIKLRKRAMSQNEIIARSAILAEKLFASTQYQSARALYGYLSFNQEIRTTPILERALADGKQIAVPKIIQNEMFFILMNDLTRIAPGFSGILEPIDDEPVARIPDALVLLPGLAFDPQGHRIGYGGGFYDRFLAMESHHPTVALCYDFQMMPEIPADDFDIPADLVICD